ncbi:phage tail protein [Gulbenkiania mobilis]|uniref:Phage protein U n=1 Tax=Gulbenkiania mobilis TaxID=397457 RepID=A0ABY2CWI5_GULMO|nr:phage protein U [Gulbenkiania mobilis]
MSGNIYAVLGETELEIIAWLDGLDMRFSAHYAEQALIGRKGLLQHTGFAPDEVKMRVLLHAQWCQPAEELARLKRIMDDAEPVAFVLGSGEYRGVFVLTDLDVMSTQTDGAGVAIAFEAEVQLKEYIGDPALPEPPGVIAQGYRIPVGAGQGVAGAVAVDALAGPFSGTASAVSQAVSAVGQVAAAASEVRSLVSLAASNPPAAVSLVAGKAGGLLDAAAALPAAAFETLSGVTAVATEAAQVATAFNGARAALEESAGWLQSGDPLAVLSSAADRAGQAVWFADQAGASLAKLAARVAVRGNDLGGVAV